MQALVLLPLLIASAVAGAILPQYTQEQNTATGEYGYSYSGGPSAKTEFRALDGTTTGAYSYVDAHGILQTVNYIADEFGFRAAGSNIPAEGVAPLDAPDVAAAKAAHLAEHNRASLQALSGHHIQKRGIFAAPALPVVHSLPVATSSQSRVQIHNNAKIISHEITPVVAAAPVLAAAPLAAAPALLLRKKRGIGHGYFPAAVELRAAPIATVSHSLPLSTSSQSRYQIHNNARIIQEVHQPIYAPAAPVVAAAPVIEAKAALPLAAPAIPVVEHLPVSTSSQSRFQIHHGAKIVHELHQPIYAAAPVAHHYYPASQHLYPAAAPAELPAAIPARPELLPANESQGYPVQSELPAGQPAGPAVGALPATSEDDDAISVDSA